jgi:poly(hydroxyalkanoate) depolymerase family esterase
MHVPGVSQESRATYTSADGTRELVVFRPASSPAKASERALVVMLHGCAQGADDLARGTRMNAEAETKGFIVVYPEQPVAANPQRCWNWFSPEQTTRGRGEVALLAGMIDSVARANGVGASRVSLVGISAGAAMAASLAVAYPERYAALAMHSGVPALAAKDVMGGLAVMRSGPADVGALGAAAAAAMGQRARAIPVIAIQGADDKIVAPANLAAIVAQWNVVNNGRAPVEQHMLPGVGHAWSGGSADGSFTAPSGPDATGMVVAFLRRIGAL